MKKTGLIAAIAALSAAAGALTVGALYLRRREKELDEYEELLFGDTEEIPVEEPEEEQKVEIQLDEEEAPVDAEPTVEDAPAEEPAE